MKKITNQTVVTTMCNTNKEVYRACSGETLVFETKDCFGNTISSEEQTISTVPWECINPATGPVYVEGASIGDTLKVDILDIVLTGSSTVATGPKCGVFGDDTTEERTRIMTNTDGVLKFSDKLSFPINPMIGVIGTAPAGEGVATGTPDAHGGNMDCKKIVKGSTLYLPVNVDGALLAMGDVHALMGDGEVCICGAETPAEITVCVTVVKEAKLPTPFLICENKAMALYSAETMDLAAKGASYNMNKFLVDNLDMDMIEAAMLLSLKGDLAICQMVDPLITVRMELDMDILYKYGYKLP